MSRTPHILMVEDNPLDREFLPLAFEEIGVGVRWSFAADGEAAIQILELLADAPEHRPDLMVLDLNMPLKTGFDVLAHRRGNDRIPHIPIVVFTTSERPAEHRRAIELGAEAVLVKPSSFEGLLGSARAMARYIDSAGEQPSLRVMDLLRAALAGRRRRAAGC